MKVTCRWSNEVIATAGTMGQDKADAGCVAWATRLLGIISATISRGPSLLAPEYYPCAGQSLIESQEDCQTMTASDS